jgi:hypothetical protein
LIAGRGVTDGKAENRQCMSLGEVAAVDVLKDILMVCMLKYVDVVMKMNF